MPLHLEVISSTSKLKSNTRAYFLLISLFVILVKCNKYKFSVSSIEATSEQTSLVLKFKGKISIAFKVLRVKKSNVFVLVSILAKSYNFLHHFFIKGF